MAADSHRLVLGAMTGTSIDGIDLALVEIRGAGLAMRAAFVRGRSAELGSLAPRLRAAAEQRPLAAQEFARLSLEFGELHARELASLAGHDRIDLAAVHGQTVSHAPPASWQLVNPFPIAAALRCPVLHDLRQADLAAGGQGAPITPLADWILFRAERARVIVNLGGFANATSLPSSPDAAAASRDPHAPTPTSTHAALALVRGADLCACNHLLDRAARAALGKPFDRDGAVAARGTPDAARAADLESRLDRQRRAGRSLGTGDEIVSWADETCAALAPEHALATTVAGVAAVVGRGIRELAPDAEEVLVAGGGARNRTLLLEIARRISRPIAATDSAGIPAEYREAAEMAILGALAADGVPITLPQVTGRRPGQIADGLLCRPPPSAAPAGDRAARNTI